MKKGSIKTMPMITDGIVIRENNVGEYDRAITVLTRDYGIVQAFSVGARRIKSKKNASTSLLAYSRFSFVESKNSLRVEDAIPKEMFFSLRNDIVKLSVAQYICELCCTLAPRDEHSESYLRLILNTIHFLSKDDSDPHILKSIAEMQLLCLSGYQPNLIACNECGAYECEKMYFGISSAELICDNCNKDLNDKYFLIDTSVLAALRHITYAPLERLFNFKLSKERARYLSSITESYMLEKTERNYKTLEFLHSVDI